jgi:hypothetical protein
MEIGNIKNLTIVIFVSLLLFVKTVYAGTQERALTASAFLLGSFVGLVWLFTDCDGAADDDNGGGGGGGSTYGVGDAWPKGTGGTANQVGWVFYCENDIVPCKHGLIAATSDVAGTHVWGCKGTNILQTKVEVWRGKTNTQEILNQQGPCVPSPAAAIEASNYSVLGYNDWFLPSRDELDFMYQSLHIAGIGNFSSVYYWSSSQNNQNRARSQDFSSGVIVNNDNKDNSYNIRPAREF